MENYKELSIEEKAKRYDDLLVKLQKAKVDDNVCDDRYCCVIDDIVPELKESDDERIRKSLSAYFAKFKPNDMWDDNFSFGDILAWLEKQGEQKATEWSSEQSKTLQTDDVPNESSTAAPLRTGAIGFDGEPMESKPCEQKPADKVEPKFKVGDWVMVDRPVLITKVEDMPYNNHQYWTSDGTWFGDGTEAKLWTIQDAKDGDVLCCESGWTCLFKALDNHTNTFSSYCFMDSDKWFCNTGSEGHTLDKAFIKAYNGEIHPATKEQRGLLFQEMHEAGYEWDAEKLELKKVEQKHVFDVEIPFGTDSELVEETITIPDGCYAIIEDNKVILRKGEQKPAWSEDEEKLVKNLISTLSNLHARNLIEKETKEKYTNWLKSIIHQNKWKPSDKQMEYLAKAITTLGNEGDNKTSAILYELRTDLKKLKEE